MVLVVVTSAVTSLAVIALLSFRKPRPVDVRTAADLISRTAPEALKTMQGR